MGLRITKNQYVAGNYLKSRPVQFTDLTYGSWGKKRVGTAFEMEEG